MNGNQRGNALLLEMIIIIVFFTLSAVVLSGIYAGAFRIEKRTDARDEAIFELQNLADRLYTAEDAQAFLTEYGFEAEEDGNRKLQKENYLIIVQPQEESVSGGSLLSYTLTAESSGTTLLTLPVVRFREVLP